MQTHIGIVIPVRNCLDYTLLAVDSIRTTHPYTLIVVDDHSNQLMHEWLISRPEIISISNPPGSTGLAFNWNVGIRAALAEKCTHVLVINSDIVFHPAAIDNLVERIDRGDAAVVTGVAVPGNTTSLRDLPDIIPEEDTEFHHPDFCCFMLTERTLATVGWFDERYAQAYYEDCDYHAAVLASGQSAIGTTLAPIYHFGSRTITENSEAARQIGRVHPRNCGYFIGKWNGHPNLLLKEPSKFQELYYKPALEPAAYRLRHQQLRRMMVCTLFQYRRPDQAARQMTFRPDQFIGQGAAQSEVYWNLRAAGEDWVFDFSNAHGLTSTLSVGKNGVWRGSPIDNPNKSIELIPLPTKLDIGSGGRAADYLGLGWLGVDAFSADADIRANMWELPYEDGEVEEIFSSHALEHVGKHDVPVTLQEWHRVLKPGGKITIRVPDLEWCCQHWLAHQTTGWDLDVLFGHQSHPGEFHKTGFSEAILISYVRRSSLHITRFERLNTHAQMTLSIECTKK